MGAGLKRPAGVGAPAGRMDAGKGAFKKMKVDLAPTLVTKPFKSVGGLKKPFRPPTFKDSGAAKGTREDDDMEVEVVEERPAPVPKARPKRAPTPEPVPENEEEERHSPQPKTASKRTKVPSPKEVDKGSETIEIDDDEDPQPSPKTSSTISVPDKSINFDDESDTELAPVPSGDIAPLSAGLGRIWNDEEMDVVMGEADSVHSSSAGHGGEVTLLHEHSTKLPERKRRKGFETLRKALFQVFISGASSGRLWGKLPRAPASSDRRCVAPILHDVASV